MFPREVRVGTRASLLALAQTRWVIARLQEAAPGVRFTVVTVRTEGDRDRSTPLPAMGGGASSYGRWNGGFSRATSTWRSTA